MSQKKDRDSTLALHSKSLQVFEAIEMDLKMLLLTSQSLNGLVQSRYASLICLYLAI